MDNMDENKVTEIISALADGQLRDDEFARAVEMAAGDPVAREAWHTYHLIGEVLRTGGYGAGTAPAQFLGRLQQRLQQEPARVPAAKPMPAIVRTGTAANDSSFRWKVVAGFASLAAVAAIGWSVAGLQPTQPPQPQLAVAPATPPGTVLAGTERGVMLRDPRLDEFLAAHRQLGGASALQMPAGFIRNATFESAGR